MATLVLTSNPPKQHLTDDSAHEKIGKMGSCLVCRRSVGCTKTVFKIVTVVGVLITLLGTLFLIAILAPKAGALTPFLGKVSTFVQTLSTGLGVDPFNFSLFTTVLGVSAFISGVGCWGYQNYKLGQVTESFQKTTENEENTAQIKNTPFEPADSTNSTPYSNENGQPPNKSLSTPPPKN